MWTIQTPEKLKVLAPVFTISSDLVPIGTVKQDTVPTALGYLAPTKIAKLYRVTAKSSFVDALTKALSIRSNYLKVANSSSQELIYVPGKSIPDTDFFSMDDNYNELSNLGKLYIVEYSPYSAFNISVTTQLYNIKSVEDLDVYTFYADKVYLEDSSQPKISVSREYVSQYSFSPATVIYTEHTSSSLSGNEGSAAVLNHSLAYQSRPLALYPNNLTTWQGIRCVQLNGELRQRAYSLEDLYSSDNMFYIDSSHILANL
jgi:hypothetical protein